MMKVSSGINKGTPLADGVNGAPRVEKIRTDGASEGSDLIVTVGQKNSYAGADVDMDKVERIRQSIADGTFEINPEKIARAMIRDIQEMLGAPEVISNGA